MPLDQYEALPRFDQIEGAPHPSQTQHLVGQERAEADLLDAFNSQRLHHGWLVTGPKGIGKATLTWKFAKFLRATPAAGGEQGLFGDAPDLAISLDISPDHPVSRRILAQSEPGILGITRGYDEKRKKFRQAISVDDVRTVKSFFSMSSSDGGKRVVIIDCAEDMNASAANAVLKVLEEPPRETYLFLISHQPAQLLPTIRSRCRTIDLRPLNDTHFFEALNAAGIDTESLGDEEKRHLINLSNGSVGEAIRYINLNGLQYYEMILDILGSFPDLNTSKTSALADSLSGAAKAREFDVFLSVLDKVLHRLARHSLDMSELLSRATEKETAVFSELCKTPAAARHWADAAQSVSDRTRHGQAVNLDPAALILDTFLKLETCAKACAHI